jgi:hypothetical protein
MWLHPAAQYPGWLLLELLRASLILHALSSEKSPPRPVGTKIGFQSDVIAQSLKF